MTKFITKPNSKFDNRFLIGMCLWSYECEYIIINSVITTWWLALILSSVAAIIFTCIIMSWYIRKYNKNVVLLKLTKQVNVYIDECFADAILVFDEQKGCKIIDEICKATIVPIEERKLLFDRICLLWTELDKAFYNKVYPIPNFIIEKWKRAQVEYRKFEIENE